MTTLTLTNRIESDWMSAPPGDDLENAVENDRSQKSDWMSAPGNDLENAVENDRSQKSGWMSAPPGNDLENARIENDRSQKSDSMSAPGNDLENDRIENDWRRLLLQRYVNIYKQKKCKCIVITGFFIVVFLDIVFFIFFIVLFIATIT